MPSDVDLIRACRLWDKITEKMHDGEFEVPDELNHAGHARPYSEGDYRPLQCRIQEKSAELTVGSSTNHKAKVDLEKGTLQYFDTDDAPNQVMSDLLEEAGLRCEIDRGFSGVACSGVTKKNVQEVFKVLAMPTSMDFRLDNCKRGGVDADEDCSNSCRESLDNDYTMPSGCDCSEWLSDCQQECVDNYEYPESEDCQEIEKNFFRDGPKKIELTEKEKIVNPKSQTTIAEWGE